MAGGRTGCGLAWRARKRSRGQAMIEFALVFPVMLVLMLCVIEMAQLTVAHQVVQYASFMAARSAIVNGSFDKAAVLATMSQSPSGNFSGSTPPGDLLALVGKLRVDNAANRFKNAFWQTYVWVDCYNSGGSRIQRITAHEQSAKPQNLPSGTDHVRAGVLYLYPLRFPVVGTLVNFMAKHTPGPGTSDTRDIFGTDPDPAINDAPWSTDDQWSQALRVSKQYGGMYVPIVKWCMMGVN